MRWASRMTRSVLGGTRQQGTGRHLPSWDPFQGAEHARSATFSPYGLGPSWRGSRHLLDTTTEPTPTGQPVTTLVQLAHGDPNAGDGAAVVVTTAAHLPDVQPWADSHARFERAWITDEEARRLPLGLAELQERRLPSVQRLVAVDGRPMACGLLILGKQHWVAECDIGDVTVTAEAWRLPFETLELARVTDLTPYVQGALRLPYGRRSL
jgi:hypothetical protein